MCLVGSRASDNHNLRCSSTALGVDEMPRCTLRNKLVVGMEFLMTCLPVALKSSSRIFPIDPGRTGPSPNRLVLD